MDTIYIIIIILLLVTIILILTFIGIIYMSEKCSKTIETSENSGLKYDDNLLE